MKRAIFFDVDGTILNHDQEVSASTRDALKRAADNGHVLLLCTGRCKGEIYSWMWDLGFSGLVGSNGAYVELDGEVLSDVSFAPDDIHELYTWFQEVGAGFMWQAPDALYPAGSFLDRYQSGNAEGIPGDWTRYAQLISPYVRFGVPERASKVTFVLPRSSGLTLHDVVDHFGERFTIVNGSMMDGREDNGELSPRGMDKSVGLNIVAEKLGIPIEQTVAIGDSANDVHMLAFAGVGVAMGNGTTEVKKAAHWVTKSVDEGGIAYALEKLELI